MSAQIVLAINDPTVAGHAAALAEEGAFDVIDAVEDLDRVVRGLHRAKPDVLVLHDVRGTGSALRLTAEIGASFPEVAVVLILAELTAEHMRTAMQAGARDVVSLPLSLEELQIGVRTAAEWGRTMRERVASEPEAALATGLNGRMLAVAAAKGGCGATTLAIHLALAALEYAPSRICIVDLDLQTGDFRNFLDLPYRRSIHDLVEVSQELSVRHLDETLYVHRSGLRVLLAPEQGEHAEDVSGAVARAVLGALRARHDLTIVDVGAGVSDATAAACELADDVLVVTTPDVLALRGAQRLMALWKRVQVVGPAPRVVLNRASRKREVQADLARQVVGSALCKTTVPADFAALETAINTGMPDRLEERKLRDAITELADEVGLLVDAPPEEELVEAAAEPEARGLVARLTGDRGQTTVETMGIMPVIGLIVLMIWQVGLIGYTYMITSHAAREGARASAVGYSAAESIREDVPTSWHEGMRCAVSDTRVRVSIPVPVVLPGLESPWRLNSQAGITSEQKPVGPIDRELKEPVKRKDDACRPDEDKDTDKAKDEVRDEPQGTFTTEGKAL